MLKKVISFNMIMSKLHLTLSLTLFFIALILQPSFGLREFPNKSPHIVIIQADDMGLDDVSFRGSKEFLTPNIDALAYHGKILDRLYGGMMCSPSRSAFLTGLYPIHTGFDHGVIEDVEPWGLPTNLTTIADIFRDAGYSTNLVGKWHLGFGKKEWTPTYRGFDYHYGYWGGYIDYYQRRYFLKGPNASMGYDFRRNLEVECARCGTYVTDLLTEEAERIIAENSGTRPLFLMLNHLAPHTANDDEPLQAPEEEVKKFMHISDPRRRIYAAMVSKLDESVGRVIAALEREKMLKNSIILFQSDNGAPTVGIKGNTGSNWPLRGQKTSPWEGGVRVAGAIWSPLLNSRMSIWRQPIYVADWLPTLAAAAGIKLDAKLKLDGLNLWPQLSQASSKQQLVQREIVHTLDEIWKVVSYMRGAWKYINGTTVNGAYDQVMTFREEYELDPREATYENVVNATPTHKLLKKYDQKRMTARTIAALRSGANIKCGQMQRGCNALIEECLFNLELDPCEQNNLVYEPDHAQTLLEMRDHVERYRRSVVPSLKKLGLPEYEASRHHCTWTTFLEESATAELAQCNYFGQPCEVSF